jgi:predicted ATPase/DNA-binding SARP family transcriptional activator
VEVRLLGPVEVVDKGATITFARAKERALVAALALRVGQVVSEARLCEALWGEDPPETAVRALQTHVSRVRKALGEAAAAVETHPSGYRLDPDVELDVARAEALLAQARAGSDPESVLVLLSQAAGLWRGPSLGDLDGEPFTGEAARLEELRLVITEERIAAELALGRHATVIAELEALCAEYPLREQLWSARMLALYRAGRQAEALRAYQDLRTRLGEELGLDPSESLRDLDAAIARRDSALAWVPVATAASVQPKIGLPPNNLPVQLTSFVGRDQEMVEVAQLLVEHRLITLTGAAGCGKTRLALQLGAHRLADYRDGVWLIDLAPLADPDLLVQTVASALDVREAPTAVVSALAPQSPHSLTEIVVEHLRGRELLIVLDNCEHLLDAAAAFTQGMLRVCPQLRVLATSREPLGVSGEVSWRVRSLSVPTRHQPISPEALRDYEAVRLFVDRAKACVPSFDLNERDGPAVAQICRRLDGIPLAIELAASRIEALAPGELAERLDDRFRVLTGGSRSGLERHQTLRAAIDWSYDALPAAERSLLQGLSVFAGGCTLQAAEAVCAGDEVASGDVLELLARLVAKSLVLMDRLSTPARYRMLETIRQYSRDKLTPEDATQLRAHHVGWCLDFTARAARGVWGAEQMAWFDALEDEEDNLRQALDWTIGGGEAEKALRLVGCLGRFWMVRRRVDEGLRWTLEALALDGQAFPFARAQALISAALMLVGYFGAYDEASRLATDSLEIFRDLGIRRGTFWALHTVSIAALFKGDVETAVTSGDEALEVAREAGDPGTLAYALLNRADVAIAEADFDMVTTLLAEAHPTLRRVDDKIGLVRLLGIQGYVAIRAGRYADAIPYLEETVLQSSHIGDAAAVVWALANLGSVTLVTGDHAAARKWFEKALRASSSDVSQKRAATWLPLGDVGPGLAPHHQLAPDVGGIGLARYDVESAYLDINTTRQALDKTGLPSAPEHSVLFPNVSPDSVLGVGGYDINARPSGSPGVESAFLNIFLLNGLAELALAEGDLVGAAETFANALGRLRPGEHDDVLASTTIPGSAVAERIGGQDPRVINALGMPAGESRLVTERRSGLVGPVGAFWGGWSAEELEQEDRGHSPDDVPQRSQGPGWLSNDGTWTWAAGFAEPVSVTVGAARESGAVFAPTSSSVGEHVLLPSILAGIAKVAVATGANERAARLFGASERLRGSTTSLHRQGRWILFEHRYDEAVDRSRSALQADAYEIAFAEGQGMTSDAAIEYAFDTLATHA